MHLIDEATIVDRGERVRVWFVPLGDTWIRAESHPTAQSDEVRSSLDASACPPGTVWQRVVELTLPKGTPLLSRVTSPLTETFDPIDYLVKERRGVRRKVDETWFCVSGNYRLTKTQKPTAFARAQEVPPAADEPPLESPAERKH